MGTYTEFHCDLKIKKDIPLEAIEAIKFMCDEESIYKNEDEIRMVFPTAKIFNCRRVCILIGNCVGIGSEYAKEYVKFSMPYTKFYYDNTTKQWFLKCISNFKNYDDNIDKFFKWISPFVEYENEKVIGYSLHEDYDFKPIYYRVNKDTGIIEPVNFNKDENTMATDNIISKIKQKLLKLMK